MRDHFDDHNQFDIEPTDSEESELRVPYRRAHNKPKSQATTDRHYRDKLTRRKSKHDKEQQELENIRDASFLELVQQYKLYQDLAAIKSREIHRQDLDSQDSERYREKQLFYSQLFEFNFDPQKLYQQMLARREQFSQFAEYLNSPKRDDEFLEEMENALQQQTLDPLQNIQNRYRRDIEQINQVTLPELNAKRAPVQNALNAALSFSAEDQPLVVEALENELDQLDDKLQTTKVTRAELVTEVLRINSLIALIKVVYQKSLAAFEGKYRNSGAKAAVHLAGVSYLSGQLPRFIGRRTGTNLHEASTARDGSFVVAHDNPEDIDGSFMISVSQGNDNDKFFLVFKSEPLQASEAAEIQVALDQITTKYGKNRDDDETTPNHTSPLASLQLLKLVPIKSTLDGQMQTNYFLTSDFGNYPKTWIQNPALQSLLFHMKGHSPRHDHFAAEIVDLKHNEGQKQLSIRVRKITNMVEFFANEFMCNEALLNPSWEREGAIATVLEHYDILRDQIMAYKVYQKKLLSDPVNFETRAKIMSVDREINRLEAILLALSKIQSQTDKIHEHGASIRQHVANNEWKYQGTPQPAEVTIPVPNPRSRSSLKRDGIKSISQEALDQGLTWPIEATMEAMKWCDKLFNIITVPFMALKKKDGVPALDYANVDKGLRPGIVGLTTLQDKFSFALREANPDWPNIQLPDAAIIGMLFMYEGVDWFIDGLTQRIAQEHPHEPLMTLEDLKFVIDQEWKRVEWKLKAKFKHKTTVKQAPTNGQ